ncbi:MAG: type I-E CRISPR-associated protein Cse1/CasA [bacterium]
MSYNLLEERWIPVLWNDGNQNRVGIKDTLTEAHRIRQIAATNPMDRVAILRFLLALLYWCKGNPPTDTDVTSGDSFPADWFSKLNENKDCFNLLVEGKRFYQYRKEGDKPLTADYLFHEIPTGTNFSHFRHSTDGMNGLCPACCAIGLLRLPVFSTSGGRGKPPNINAKPPIYVIPLGDSLAETLRLSWRSASHLGTPAWEKPDLRLPETGEVPLLTGLTWLPRRVWLGNQQEGKANCISCGRRDRLILSCVFAPIGSTRTDEDGPGRIWRDPHVIYEQSKKGDVTSLHSTNALDAADAGAGQWTRPMAGSLRGVNNSATIWCVGFSTVQNDKYLEATEFFLPSPSSQDRIDFSIAMLDKWQQSNFSLIRRLKPLDEKTPRKHVEIPPMLAAIRPHIEGKVSAKVGELLSGGDAAWQEAAHEYRPMMEMVAMSLSPGFTTAAVQRRKQIANVMLIMGQRAQEAKKSAKGKRGKK